MTAKEWISEKWREPIRSKCLEYVEKWPARPEQVVDYDRSALKNAFHWGETPEGFDAWDLVDDHLFTGHSITAACAKAGITLEAKKPKPDDFALRVTLNGDAFDPDKQEAHIAGMVEERDALNDKIRKARVVMRKYEKWARGTIENEVKR